MHRLQKFRVEFPGCHTQNEEDLCAQFENGLRLEIQQAVSYMQITNFNQLVKKCRIF